MTRNTTNHAKNYVIQSYTHHTWKYTGYITQHQNKLHIQHNTNNITHHIHTHRYHTRPPYLHLSAKPTSHYTSNYTTAPTHPLTLNLNNTPLPYLTRYQPTVPTPPDHTPRTSHHTHSTHTTTQSSSPLHHPPPPPHTHTTMAELLSVQVPCGRTIGGYAEFHKSLVTSSVTGQCTPTLLSAKQRAYTHSTALHHNRIR